MPTPCRRAFVLALLILGFAGFAPAAAQARPDEARAALEKARAFYSGAGAFRETLEATVELPGGRKEPKVWEYGVGPGGEAFMTLASNGQVIFRLLARDGRMVATQLNLDERYVEAPFQGDFAASLRRIGGPQAQLGPPPAVVARLGGDLAAFLDALRFGILTPLEIVGFRPAVAEDGGPRVEVELRAAQGTATFWLDAGTHRPRELRFVMGEGAQQVRFTGRYRFAPGDPGAALAWPDLAGRTAVATFAELEVKDYPLLGQPAPEIAIPSFAGGSVGLADLKGSVVVLDFWATWCVPCWSALTHTAELAEWAKSSGLPVKVFAVDTMENAGDLEEQRRRAADFLRAKKLDLPVLLDFGDKAFAAFRHPGLPSLVIIGRDGKLARYHSGLLEDMAKVIRAEVLELAK